MFTYKSSVRNFSLTPRWLLVIAVLAATHTALSSFAQQTNQAPFPYVWGTAYHVLPHTTSDESGYFSLCEGRDGKVYVGSAQYNYNSYLVEFDPRTAQQRIVIDTRKLCGLGESGYAAQAKIHTRNFVGPSGKIYVGSKQGYKTIPGDQSQYPGGYLMTYNPKTDKAECLGMPLAKEGIIDAVADEKRGRIYVVTCEEQHYVVYDTMMRNYRELGPRCVPYATTLIDKLGRANVITENFQLAQYDPGTDKVVTRDLFLDGKRIARGSNDRIFTWNLAADERTAYLIFMTDPTLIEIDLLSGGETVTAKSRGKMIEGKHPDSRCAMSIAPNGTVYALIRVDNDTTFGGGYLHHLTGYSPRRGRIADLGVLAVKNPDFFDFSPLWNGQPKPWTHGYHKLPDGTLTPLHSHMGMIVAHDGSIYVTILYPYTLLRIAPNDLPWTALNIQ